MSSTVRDGSEQILSSVQLWRYSARVRVLLDLDPDFPSRSGIGTAGAGVAVLTGIVLVVIVGLIVYRSVRLARRGVNPLTLQEDVATRVLQSDALGPARSKAERLAELDALHADGRITGEEHAAARARVLAD